MSSAKKQRELNRAKVEHDKAKLSAQFSVSNHAMLNIAESVAARRIEQLTRQRDLAVSAATKARNAAHQCASVCSKHLDVYPALMNMIDVVDGALVAIKESELDQSNPA